MAEQVMMYRSSDGSMHENEGGAVARDLRLRWRAFFERELSEIEAPRTRSIVRKHLEEITTVLVIHHVKLPDSLIPVEEEVEEVDPETDFSPV